MLAILLLLVSISLAMNPASANNTTSMVQMVCGEATQMPVPYSDCVQALNNDFRTKTVKDLRELTFLSLDLAMANSSEAMGYVRGLAENSPPALKSVLQSCADSLLSSYRSFHGAVGDLMEDAMAANYDVFVAMDGPTNCRNQMQEANVSIPSVSVLCGYVELFAQVCYTTTDMLQRKGR